MKLRFIAVLLTLILILSTFSGCGLLALEAKLDAAEDTVEYRVDQVEEKAESAARDVLTPDRSGASEKETRSKPDTASAKLTKEQAETVALEHAGFTADGVDRMHSEYEYDDGVPHFDVQFRDGNMEYEYEIHADTGEILSYERDR